MVHTFKIDEKYFLYDIESGSLHLCDKLSFFLVKNLNGEKIDLSDFDKTEIEECKAEIKKLESEGLLFSKPADYSNLEINSKAVKALCLNVSQNCNLECKYCFLSESGGLNGQNMTIKTAKAAIDFSIRKSDKKNLEVDFFGGEPLLNFNVVKDTVFYAIEQAKKFQKAFKFTLTTNGLILNDEVIEFLNLYMDNVVISIDGSREVHNNLRKTKNGSGSFDIVLKNALAFKKKRGDKNYYIRGTFTNLNLDFSKDILFLNDCGFDQISIEPVVLRTDDTLAIRKKHLAKIKTEYQKFAKVYLELRKTDKWFNFFHFSIDLKNSPCIKKRISACGAGLSYLAVSANGDIYPCHQFVGKAKYILGNVFNEGLNENIRDKFCANLLTKEKCRNCFAKYYCGGGCAYNCILTNSDINKPDEITCEIFKSRLECSLYVYAMENSRQI